jgi:hypothetical protein
MRSKTGILAFLASFSVYFIPLVGPHSFSFLGEMFFPWNLPSTFCVRATEKRFTAVICPEYTRTQVLFPGKDLFLYSSAGKTLLVQILR